MFPSTALHVSLLLLKVKMQSECLVLGNRLMMEIATVEGKDRFGTTYQSQFVSVLHEVMVHSTLLQKCTSGNGISMEC